VVVPLAVTVVMGVLLAIQARVNGELAVRLGDAVLAALVSFVVGLVAAVVLAAVVVGRRVTRSGPSGLWARRHELRWWHCLGGLGGAGLVTASAIAVPEIGVALLTVGLVAGQTSGGLLVDRIGLGPGGKRPSTLPRVAGAVLAVVAVSVAAAGQRGAEGAVSVVVLLLVLLAGLAVAVQTALTGRVTTALGDPTLAVLVNFLVGTAALALLVGLLAGTGRLGAPQWPGSWWLYLGGPIGVVFVTAAAVYVRVLGVLRLGLAAIAGQLLGALVLDVAAPAGGGLSGWTVAGAALTLVAVAVSGRGGRGASGGGPGRRGAGGGGPRRRGAGGGGPGRTRGRWARPELAGRY